MKEATGELNMTVVTLIAIAAIAALFYFAIWPMVQRMLVQQTCNTYGEYTAVKDGTSNASGTGNARVDVWCCCPKDKETSGTCTNDCIRVNDTTGKDNVPTGGDGEGGN